MMTAVRQRVTVQPGGRVEVQSAQLPAGAEAEVIILVDGSAQATARSQLEALKKLQDSLNLSPQTAQDWIAEARAQRRAWASPCRE